MKTWLSASEIAALALPGLPRTRQGVLDLAAREGWHGKRNKVRQGKGRGAPIEFHIDLLPVEARDAYVARSIARLRLPDEVAAEAAAEPGADVLPARAGKERDARLWLLSALDRFVEGSTLGAKIGAERFARRYGAGAIDVPSWVRERVPDLSPRSLARWRAEAKAGRKSSLAVDHAARRKGKGALETAEDGAVRTFVLGIMANQPHLSVDNVRNAVVDRYPALETLSVRTFAHQIKVWRERYKVELLKLTNPDAFRSKVQAAVKGGSHPVSRLNELWMIDASPADVLTTEGRYSVYACIDIFSRRLRIYVTKTPRAEAVALLMRKAILAWGVPERVLTDNGSDFVAVATQRLLAGLGIEVEHAPPHKPEAKPHVERVIHTFQHDFAETLPGYVGHSVADRKVIEERKAFAARLGEGDDALFSVDLSPAELQERSDRYTDGRYAARKHEGLGGISPLERSAEFRGTVRRVDPKALDMLLAPAAGGGGVRTVTKTGVRVAGNHYLSAEVLAGTRVLVRMDPQDAGRVRLYAEDGEAYLGEGICPELSGHDPAELAGRVRAAHAAILKAGTAEIRKAQKAFTPRDAADAIERQGMRAAENVVAFPHREVAHTTPALEAAAAAAEAEAAALPRDGMDPAEVRAFFDRMEEHGRRVDEAVTGKILGAQAEGEGNVVALRTSGTPALRYAFAARVEREMARGVEVPLDDAMWLGGYQREPEYIAQLPNAERRFAHTLRLAELERTTGPLWPREQKWLSDYKRSPEYVTMLGMVEDFGEDEFGGA